MASFTLGAIGARTVVGIVLESTWGTDPTGTTTTIAVKSCTLEESCTFDEGADLWAGVGGIATQRVETARDVAGELGGLAGYSALGLIWQAAWGTKATSGAGPYEHLFTLSRQTALPSLTLREAVRDPDADDHQRVYTGCVINELTLDFGPRGSIAEWRATIIGKAQGSDADATPAAPTIPTLVQGSALSAFSFNTISYAGRVKSVKVKLSNGLARQDVQGALTAGGIVPSQRRQISVEAGMLLGADQIAVLRTAMKAGTRSDLTITYTSGAQIMSFVANDAQIVAMPNPASQYGDRMVTVTWKPIDDGTNLGLSMTVTNANSSSAS